MATTKKKLLVVGYGAAGSQTACAMAKTGKYTVVVLTPFEYMEVSLSMTMVMAVGPDAHEQVLFPLLRDPGIEFIIGTCKTIDDKSVTTSTGQVITFDVCVLATGQNMSVYSPNPETEPTREIRKANVAKIYNAMQAAKTLVIGGGGPLGVETASDIKLRNKDKKVILVHAQSTVISTMGHGIPASATKTLQDYGIELILNEKVQQYSPEKGCVELKSGRSIPCDYYLPAFSSRQGNCGFLPPASQQDGYGPGYAKVDETFRVSGFLNVFAVGDCSSISDAKLLAKVDDQVKHLVKNISKVLDGRGQTLAPFVPPFPGGVLTGPILISLGHGHPDAYGFGPDIPGCCGSCIVFCCCCCGPPKTKMFSGIKSDFNKTVTPKPGIGLSK